MKGLKVILWILAIAFMTGFVFMILPWGVIDGIYSIAGEPPFPKTPVADYSLRVTCAIVGAIGIYFLFLALNPSKYRILVFYSSYALMAIGLLCVVIGLIVGVSPAIIIGDGGFGIILGLILLLMSFKALKT